MLKSYFPIYELALRLEGLRANAEFRRGHPALEDLSKSDTENFRAILEAIIRICPDYGLTHTPELAAPIIGRPLPKTHGEMFSALTHLNDSLSNELKKDSVFRIPPERKDYFGRPDLFGPEVAAAFPSCVRDIQRAGSCYALGQEDACVHHLMLVLERGLNALATKVGVTYERTNWQSIIGDIKKKVEGGIPRGPERDFYLEVNAQFGFLKDAYRNHAEHARDDHYDMPKALSIFNHVREFMRALQKGRLSE